MTVPLSKLPTIIEEAKAKMDKTGVLASIVAHAGDGNFHNIILYVHPLKETVILDELAVN